VAADRQSKIEVTETAGKAFELTVTFGDRIFHCGSYLDRSSALQAGRLFVARKEGEALGQKKRPRKK